MNIYNLIYSKEIDSKTKILAGCDFARKSLSLFSEDQSVALAAIQITEETVNGTNVNLKEVSCAANKAFVAGYWIIRNSDIKQLPGSVWVYGGIGELTYAGYWLSGFRGYAAASGKSTFNRLAMIYTLTGVSSIAVAMRHYSISRENAEELYFSIIKRRLGKS